MRYAIVIEKAAKNYAAYAPDIPGCIATGKTVAETLRLMREALELHLEGMVEDGEAIPDPVSMVEYVEVRWPEMTTQATARTTTNTGQRRKAS